MCSSMTGFTIAAIDLVILTSILVAGLAATRGRAFRRSHVSAGIDRGG